MSYKTNEALPENVPNVLPKHAQDIYRGGGLSCLETVQGLVKTTGERNARRNGKVTWSAIKHTYEKRDDSDHHWHPKK